MLAVIDDGSADTAACVMGCDAKADDAVVAAAGTRPRAGNPGAVAAAAAVGPPSVFEIPLRPVRRPIPALPGTACAASPKDNICCGAGIAAPAATGGFVDPNMSNPLLLLTGEVLPMPSKSSLPSSSSVSPKRLSDRPALF